MDNLVIREMHAMSDFNALLDLQQVIWGMTPGEATSPYMMNAVVHNGGVVIGAELDGRLVGFCFGFLAWRDETRILWSHMAGVLPEYHDQGIGSRLKHAQRRWALDRGLTTMHWTFDPVQRGNANFNFHHLRAIADTYLVDHYGVMTDAINAGLASDRLEVRWLLNDERVIAAAENRPLAGPEYTVDEAAFVLRAGENAALIRSPETAFAYPACFIEIPYHVNALKRSAMALAQRWQLAMRQAMLEALQQGYVIVDFVCQDERGWYVLMRGEAQAQE
jgi:predicted GNAT superfamily acetyltransferase